MRSGALKPPPVRELVTTVPSSWVGELVWGMVALEVSLIATEGTVEVRERLCEAEVGCTGLQGLATARLAIAKPRRAIMDCMLTGSG